MLGAYLGASLGGGFRQVSATTVVTQGFYIGAPIGGVIVIPVSTADIVTGTIAATEAPDDVAISISVQTPINTGYHLPTLGAIVNGGWQNPQNICADDDALTVALQTELPSIWFLSADHFAFDGIALPPDAIITKVELAVEWKIDVIG